MPTEKLFIYAKKIVFVLLNGYDFNHKNVSFKGNDNVFAPCKNAWKVIKVLAFLFQTLECNQLM